jgi:hypothetical protein
VSRAIQNRKPEQGNGWHFTAISGVNLIFILPEEGGQMGTAPYNSRAWRKICAKIQVLKRWFTLKICRCSHRAPHR